MQGGVNGDARDVKRENNVINFVEQSYQDC